MTSIYLGKGTEMAEYGFSLKSVTENGSANLEADGKNWKVSCNQETEVGLPLPKTKKAILKFGTIQNELKISHTSKGITVNIPAVRNAELLLE